MGIEKSKYSEKKLQKITSNSNKKTRDSLNKALSNTERRDIFEGKLNDAFEEDLLEMDDNQAHNFCIALKEIMQETPRKQSKEAHEYRYQFLKDWEAFIPSVSRIQNKHKEKLYLPRKVFLESITQKIEERVEDNIGLDPYNPQYESPDYDDFDN